MFSVTIQFVVLGRCQTLSNAMNFYETIVDVLVVPIIGVLNSSNTYNYGRNYRLKSMYLAFILLIMLTSLFVSIFTLACHFIVFICMLIQFLFDSFFYSLWFAEFYVAEFSSNSCYCLLLFLLQT